MPELGRVRGALRRWWWLVVAATVVGAIGGGVSAAASGGPQWVTTATVTLGTELTLPEHGHAIDLVPVQVALDRVTSASARTQSAATFGATDVSTAIARHGPDDEHRIVHITVASTDRARAAVVVDADVQRFRGELATVQQEWRAAALATLDRASASDPHSTELATLREVTQRLGGDDLVTATDIDAARAPASTAAVAALAALALGGLTAALVVLLAGDQLRLQRTTAASVRAISRKSDVTVRARQ